MGIPMAPVNSFSMMSYDPVCMFLIGSDSGGERLSLVSFFIGLAKPGIRVLCKGELEQSDPGDFTRLSSGDNPAIYRLCKRPSFFF